MLFHIITRNGTFFSVGNTEHEATINFTISFPNEKIRKITQMENKAIHISQEEFDMEDFE